MSMMVHDWSVRGGECLAYQFSILRLGFKSEGKLCDVEIFDKLWELQETFLLSSI